MCVLFLVTPITANTLCAASWASRGHAARAVSDRESKNDMKRIFGTVTNAYTLAQSQSVSMMPLARRACTHLHTRVHLLSGALGMRARPPETQFCIGNVFRACHAD